MDGSANFAITVAKEAKVEGAGAKAPRHEAKPAPAAAPKIDEKPKGTKPDVPVGSDKEPAK